VENKNMIIYGEKLSRAERSLWAADECGVDYEHSTDPVHGDKSLALLAVNPDGAIPTLDDDGFILTQSWAINLYLARKYGGDLASQNDEEEARILQWSFWAGTDVDGMIINTILATGMLPHEPANPELIKANFEKLQRPLTSLEHALEGRNYLAADRFTIGDLNAVSIVSWLPLIGFDMRKFPNIDGWIKRCAERPYFPKRG